MNRRRFAALLRNMPSLAKRLAQPLSGHSLLRMARTLGPSVAVLAFAGISSVAHAQGTMDFSGATTLMGTFNVSPSTVQLKVVFANPIEIVAEQSVCTFQRETACLRNFENRLQGRVFIGARQVRQEISYRGFETFVGSESMFVRWLHSSIEIANVYQGSSDLTAGNRSIHSRVSSSRDINVADAPWHRGKM